MAIAVVDHLSGNRYDKEYASTTLVHKVKRDLRDAERPRYRFELHMGTLSLRWRRIEAGPLYVHDVPLADFKSLASQGWLFIF